MLTPKDPPKFLNEDNVNPKGFASFQEMSIAKEIIVSGFNDEFARTQMRSSADVKDEIKKFFITLWCEERLYAFFIPETLKGISERVFTHPAVRDFVLNWSDASAILLSVNDYSIDRLIKTISHGVSLNKSVSTILTPNVDDGENDGSLINARLRMTMHIEQDVVCAILQKNFWLVCIIVMYLYMSDLMADKNGPFSG